MEVCKVERGTETCQRFLCFMDSLNKKSPEGKPPGLFLFSYLQSTS